MKNIEIKLIQNIKEIKYSESYHSMYRVTDRMMVILGRFIISLLNQSDAIWIYREYMVMDAEQLAREADDGKILDRWMNMVEYERNMPDFSVFLNENYDADILVSTDIYAKDDAGIRAMFKCCILDVPAMKITESLGNKVFLPGGVPKAIVFSSQSCVKFIKRNIINGNTVNSIVETIPYNEYIRLLGIEF
ncbi:MAG: hypothetical protein ACRC0G_07560 [Fusobacteriaceae bacterium]